MALLHPMCSSSWATRPIPASIERSSGAFRRRPAQPSRWPPDVGGGVAFASTADSTLRLLAPSVASSSKETAPVMDQDDRLGALGPCFVCRCVAEPR